MISPAFRFDPSFAWARTVWNGEVAWTSVSGGVCAIVSEVRSRLIYLGAHDGSLNLLNAPRSRVSIDEGNPYPNQGGHRFWLGPQHRWSWPPPTEWEYSPAMSVAVMEGILIVKHARIDPAFPALTREYSWEGSRLLCTARWEDEGRPYFGMHILAVDTPFEIAARLETSSAAPEGMVLARMINPEPVFRLSHPAVSINGSNATVRAGICDAKFGFFRQSLTVGRPRGWTIIMHPGPQEGNPVGRSDDGYLSQVWVGDGSSAFAELEQLSPFLRGDANDRCSSTVFVEAIPPT